MPWSLASSRPLWLRSIATGSLSLSALAAAYTGLVIPMVGIGLLAANVANGKALDAALGGVAFAVLAWPFAIVLGIIPGAVIGACGGLAVGATLTAAGTRASPRTGAAIGLAVAVAIVTAAHLVAANGLLNTRPSEGPGRLVPYLFWFAGPSLLVVAGLTWTGHSVLRVPGRAQQHGS